MQENKTRTMLTGVLIGVGICLAAKFIYDVCTLHSIEKKQKPLHEMTVKELQKIMNDCVKKEDYLEAAKIRDMIAQKSEKSEVKS